MLRPLRAWGRAPLSPLVALHGGRTARRRDGTTSSSGHRPRESSIPPAHCLAVRETRGERPGQNGKRWFFGLVTGSFLEDRTESDGLVVPRTMSSSPPPGDVDLSADRKAAVIASSVAFWLLGLAAMSLRFYTRSRLAKVLGSEDWVLLGSFVFCTGVSVTQIVMTKYGWGKHIGALSPADLVSISKLTLSLLIVYQVGLALTKVSILLLYLRILHYHHARWAVYAMLLVVVAYNTWGVVSDLTLCPLPDLWSSADYEACHPVRYTWASVSLHIATDFLIFLLPIPVFFRVRMPSREKITLLVLFSLGFLCVPRPFP
ncbi:hypothetical protein VTK73DRAFT_2248 [Phialemonium thermophilum]|uniref:Rhodopsin domain-containing protein n=1 Tax=Phialemonium thermophilum TaxID=223376 RepID=A0ABR3VSG2_9PEZI